jgi:Swt1-like HEPN
MPTPLDELKSRVSSLKAEVARMLQEPAAAPSAGPTAWDVIVEEAGAAIGGALTSDFLGRSRVGSRAGRAIVRQQRLTLQRQAAVNRRTGAVAIVARVRAEVEGSRGHLDERFRRGLMGLLAEAENAHRTDTILRRTGEAVDRLLSYAPRAPPHGPSEDYLLLKRLEEALRERIVSALSALTPDWWIARVPDDVRSKAEGRKAKGESSWPWYAGKDLPLIYYVDFTDYSKIIRREDNWRDAFASIFGDPEILRTKLRELEPIRNDVAHTRGLIENGRDKLRVYSRDLLGVT